MHLSQSTPLRVVVALLAGSFSTQASASDALYSLKFENDMLTTHDDGHYTNGLELSRTALPEDDHWSRRLADSLPGWTAQGLDAYSYHVTHQIYTANDIHRSSLIENDRPYAGLLLGGVSLLDGEQHQGWREAAVLNLQAGIVGPAAGAEKLQETTHKILDSQQPQGWDHQLSNEPIANVGLHKAWWWQGNWGGLEVEYGPNVSFALGNLYTYGGGGAALRFGEGLDTSFGIPNVAPAQGERQNFLPHRGFGWYGFIGVEGRYMAHNLLLDGNTFEDSHSVDRREWVGDLQVGIVTSWDRWQLAFTSVWRTHEFEQQADSDAFGSVTLSTWL